MHKKTLLRAKALRKELNRLEEEGHCGLVTFGCVREGELEDYTYVGGPCHMGLATVSASKPVAVVSLIDYEQIKEDRHKVGYTIPYYRWLLNDSIYRDCFVTKSPIEAIHKGVICNTDVPSNLLLGALIATRYPWEYACHQFKSWCEMYRRGVNPSMAFVLCHSVLHNIGGISFQGALMGHNAIDLYDMTVEGLAVFLKGDRGEVFNPRPSLYVNNQYKGVTYIWCSSINDESTKTLISTTYKTIMKGGRKKKGLLDRSEGTQYRDANHVYSTMSKWAIDYYEEVVR